MLAGLLNVDRNLAIVITGVVAVLYVSMGGMRSVIYTSVRHAIMKYPGMIVALLRALAASAAGRSCRARLAAEMFAVDNIGWSGTPAKRSGQERIYCGRAKPESSCLTSHRSAVQ